MIPIKKLYIDSRHKTADSPSDSNFKIELPYTLQLPDNTVFFVTDVCIPNVWRTIEANLNDRLYLKDTSQIGVHFVVIKLSAGNYTQSTLATVSSPRGLTLPRPVSTVASGSLVPPPVWSTGWATKWLPGKRPSKPMCPSFRERMVIIRLSFLLKNVSSSVHKQESHLSEDKSLQRAPSSGKFRRS